MSVNMPIVWLDKINSPELLAFLQQYGHEHYLSAEEINLLRDCINELYATIEVLETEIADVAEAVANIVADSNYVHAQGTPSLTWNVAHNLNKFPGVIVVDSAKTEIGAQVDYVDANNIIITINAAASGYVYVN